MLEDDQVDLVVEMEEAFVVRRLKVEAVDHVDLEPYLAVSIATN